MFYEISSDTQNDVLFKLFDVETESFYACSNVPSRNTRQGCHVHPEVRHSPRNNNSIVNVVLFNSHTFVLRDYEVQLSVERGVEVDVINAESGEAVMSQMQQPTSSKEHFSKVSFSAYASPLSFAQYKISFRPAHQGSSNKINLLHQFKYDGCPDRRITNSHFEVSFANSSLVIRRRSLPKAELKLHVVAFAKSGYHWSSGAYLSKIMDGPEVATFTTKDISIVDGVIYTSIYMSTGRTACLEVKLHRLKGLNQEIVDLEVKTDLSGNLNDVDLAIRLINLNGRPIERVYTDANGYIMMQRRRLYHLPTYANIYPFTRALNMQLDERVRLNIFSSAPRSLHMPLDSRNAIDLILHRVSSLDDSRGMNEPLLDHYTATHKFQFLFETESPTVSEDGNGLGQATVHRPLCSSEQCDYLLKQLVFPPSISISTETTPSKGNVKFDGTKDVQGWSSSCSLPHIVQLTQLSDSTPFYRFLLILEQSVGSCDEVFVHNLLFGLRCYQFAYSSLTGKVENSRYFDCSTAPMRISDHLVAAVLLIEQ